MPLADLFVAVRSRIDRLDPGRLWPGFVLCPIALYDADTVVTAEGTFPRDDRFVANTAIPWDDGDLAIWEVTDPPGDPDGIDRLAASLVHEAFHAFQHLKGEDRFADEFDAVRRIRYTPERVQLKLNENRLITHLAERLTETTYEAFRAARAARRRAFPDAVAYEERIEWIEGAPAAVELRALEVLNPDAARALRTRWLHRLTAPEHQIPTRPLSYTVGALLIDSLERNGVPIDTTVGPGRGPYLEPILADAPEAPAMVCISDAVSRLVAEDRASLTATLDRIRTQGTRMDPDTAHTLRMFNAYAPRYLDGWLLSEGFIAVGDREGTVRVVPGDFAVAWDGAEIGAAYRAV